MRAVAAFLMCLFVVMTATDRLACADGCTDEAPLQAANPHASAPCAFCQGWNLSPTTTAPRPLDHVVGEVPAVAMRLLAPPPPTIERPPKAA